MRDPVEAFIQSLAGKLAQSFDLDEAQVSRALAEDPDLIDELRSDEQLSHAVSGDARGFQTLVKGGRANIGGTYFNVDAKALQELAKLLKSMLPTLRRIPRTGKGYIEPRLEVSNALPLHMVLIPSGSFLMGSPQDEPERTEAEGPQHQVSISSFFMGRYPVTQAQWRSVAALPEIEHKLESDPSKFKGSDRPVEQVSWYEAVEFCDRLAVHTGRPYRLPTEAEWEYACRAGTTTPFHFGSTISTEVANYDGSYTYSGSPRGEYRESTTVVDQLNNANAYGLSDMHGNVYEWCQDYWHHDYKDAPTDGSAWIEGGNADFRVLRGGSWNYLPRYCRSAYRDYGYPDNRNIGIGFRVSCAAPRILQ